MSERDFRLQAAAATAAKFYRDEGGAFSNRLNLYQCTADPTHMIITIDLEPGVTPFTIQCPHCEKAGILSTKGFYKHPEMQSAMYRVHPSLTPTHEWFRPDSLDGYNPGMVEHLLKGGLDLRPITSDVSEKTDG